MNIQTLDSDIETNKESFNVKCKCLVNYTIDFSNDLFFLNNTHLQDALKGSSRAIVIVDHIVNELYKEKIDKAFNCWGIKLEKVIIKCGENRKNLETTLHLIKKLESLNVLRREKIIAIGGGVLLDIVGFVSSIYRRGTPYISIPTTLMGMIDASIGVKTGINHLGKRNRLGSYYSSKTVKIDISFLTTLNRREIANGMAEIIKLAVIKDEELFDILEEHGIDLLESKFNDGFIATNVINRSISGMLEELAPNLWEVNLMRSVDFGHSISPLIEMKSLPHLLHGEAVILDVIISSVIANSRGLLKDREMYRIINLASSLDLIKTNEYIFDIKTLSEALEDTKKHRDGNQNLPLPCGIGNCTFINDLSSNEIKRAVKKLLTVIPEKIYA